MTHCPSDHVADQSQIVDAMLHDGIFRQRFNARAGRFEASAGGRQFQHLDASTADIDTQCQALRSAKDSHRISVP